jgi:hypothetical protein
VALKLLLDKEKCGLKLLLDKEKCGLKLFLVKEKCGLKLLLADVLQHRGMISTAGLFDIIFVSADHFLFYVV